MFSLGNKYVIYGIITTVVIVTFSAIGIGWLKIHDAAVANLATAEANRLQLEQVVKEQKENAVRLSNLAAIQMNLLEQLTKDNHKVDDQTRSIEERLTNPDLIKEDRESSEVLKETIRRLNRGQ